ncbi:hypothetical protein HI914_06019 [Erysiphe necator]|nr:hypothetical protein HI914_06019 [Erysiphe necator]
MNHSSKKNMYTRQDNLPSRNLHINPKENWNFLPQVHRTRLGEYDSYGHRSYLSREQGHESNLKIESHLMNINPAHILEVLRSRMAAILSKIGREVTSLNSYNSEEFFHEFQNLFHDFKRAQVSLLEEFEHISEAKASYYEQFTLAKSKLLQIYEERDRLSKEMEVIQQILDETRDKLKNSYHQHQKFKSQKLSCKDKNIYRGNSTYLMDKADGNSFSPNISDLEMSASFTKSGSSSSLKRPFEKLNPGPQTTHSGSTLDISSDSSLSFGSYFMGILERQNFYQEHALPKNSSIRNVSEIKKKNINHNINSYNPTYTSEDDPAPEFKVGFDKVLNMIEKWCKTNANQPNECNDAKVALQNPSLWSYMMDCVDCGDSDVSESRVKDLISSASTRYRFVMRMATTYIFKDLLSLKNFYGFNEEANKMLNDFESMMEERGMKATIRQGIIDRRDTVIKNIIEDTGYDLLRSMRLNQHSNSLRGILGSFLNEDCDFASAGRDLGAIVALSFDLCARIHSSALTFQILFPNLTTTKFNASTMIVRDKILIKPLALHHIAMTRLKLVISPMVTLRDDRGTTIKAKSLQLATVLTMI